MEYIIIFVLAFISLFLGATGAIINKPKTKKERWPYIISCISAILAIVIFVLTSVFGNKDVKELQEDQVRNRATIDSLKCDIDTLKNDIKIFASIYEENKELREKIRLEAECLLERMETEFEFAIVAIGLEQYSNALKHLRNALKNEIWDNSKRAELYFYRGIANQFNTDIALAITDYDSALVYKHNFHEAWYNRGTAFDWIGEYEDAIANFDSAIVYKPCYHEALYNRGQAYVKLGRFIEAKSNFEKAIDCKKDKYEAWNSLGICLIQIHKYDKAIESLRSALQYKHDYYLAWFNLATAYYLKEERENALLSLDSALTYNPNLKEAIELKKELLSKNK